MPHRLSPRLYRNAIIRLSNAMSAPRGIDFLGTAAEEAARAIHAHILVVGRLTPNGDAIQTVVAVREGKLVENFRYDLQGTPCEEVVKGHVCFYPDDVQAHFPDDPMMKSLGAVGYIGAPMYRRDGGILGVVSAVFDMEVTSSEFVVALFELMGSRLAAETELLEAKERLDLSLDLITDGIWEWDTASGGVSLSPRLQSLLGYDGDALAMEIDDLWNMIHPDDRPKVRDGVDRHFVDNTPLDIVVRVRCKNGGYRWFNLRGQADYNEHGDLRRIIGALNDITDVLEDQNRIEKLTTAMPGFLFQFCLSADGIYQVLYVSPRVFEPYGFDPDRIAVDAFEVIKMIHTEDQEAFDEAARESARSLTLLQMELRVLHPTRGILWLDCNGNPERLENGDTMWYGYARENTREVEERREKAELERALIQSQKLEALGQLAGGVAHEINNMLTPILLLARQSHDGIQDPTIRRYLSRIEEAAGKARTVVQDIMSFARPDTGRVGRHDLICELTKSVEFSEIAMPAGLRVLTELPEGDCKAIFSPVSMSQLILNLIKNASEAMHGEGTVIIRVAKCGSCRPELDSSDYVAENFHCICVLDEGPGVDEETSEKIFEPFYSTKEHHIGAGMGLAIAYGIVRSWGGSIYVRNRPEGGAEFSVRIPAA